MEVTSGNTHLSKQELWTCCKVTQRGPCYFFFQGTKGNLSGITQGSAALVALQSLKLWTEKLSQFSYWNWKITYRLFYWYSSWWEENTIFLQVRSCTLPSVAGQCKLFERAGVQHHLASGLTFLSSGIEGSRGSDGGSIWLKAAGRHWRMAGVQADEHRVA